VNFGHLFGKQALVSALSLLVLAKSRFD